MLVSDVIEIPYEKLADWVALIGSAVAFLIWATVVFAGFQLFVRRTRMRVLGTLLAASMLVVGLVGYFVVFVALDSATFSHAVDASFLGPPRTQQLAADLARLTRDRARTIRIGPMEARRIGFYVLPAVAAVVASVVSLRLIAR
jgi:hypothetical protein